MLDTRLVGLDERIGTPPRRGWVREIRRALGMSTYELAARLGIGQPRACQIEQAEVNGAIQLRTLGRVAEALNCRLVYAFVPDESLEHIVRYQAERKAVEVLGADRPDQVAVDGQALTADVASERLAALAYYLVDRRGLWRTEPGRAGARSDQTEASRETAR